MKTILKALLFPFLLLGGLLINLITRKTPKLSYLGLREMFVITNGRSNDFLSLLISMLHPKSHLGSSVGILGDLSKEKAETIADAIRKNGYYIFDKKLDNHIVDSIVEYASNTPCNYLKVTSENINYTTEKTIFNENEIISPRYQFTADECLGSKEIKNLVFDQNFLQIAGEYLNTKPILDLITMWWSAPFKGLGASEAAQMYHFDMDRIKFLKFFVYLTDVNSETGPHCYIEGTNQRIHNKIRKDARISDEDLKDFFEPDRIKEITGTKGTLIAVDTRGLHKGKPLTFGKRLIFQIQYSNSLFGAKYSNFQSSNISENDYLDLIKHQKRTYQLFK
jgi:hypothetical protein